jgi:hypothetical protein
LNEQIIKGLSGGKDGIKQRKKITKEKNTI